MRRLHFGLLIILMLLGGCQTLMPPRAEDAASKVVQASYFDPAPEPPAESPPSVVEELPAAESKENLPPGTPQPSLPLAAAEPLTLLDAAALTLGQNPDLIAARQAEGVSQGALGVAETYPFNPWVQLQVAPSPQRPDGSTGKSAHYLVLVQTLQLAHQRRHREAAAHSVLNGTRWNIVQAELLAVAQTERLYFTALYRRDLREVLRENAALSRQVLTISEKQLAAGAASKSDVAIARLDDAAAHRRAELAEANYQTALLDLRRQLNLPLEQTLDLHGGLANLQFSPAAAGAALSQTGAQNPLTSGMSPMVEQLAANRPDVLAAQSEFDASRANLNLAHANRVPDLQVGPFYQQTDSGTALWGIRAQSDLPVLNTGMPLVRQRAAEVNQRQTIWQQLQARASLEAAAAIDRYERARRMAAESGTSSELPEELARLEAQFQAGEIDLLRIVTARTSLLAARQARLDILSELAQAAAALTAATGLPPEVIVQIR